MMLNPVHFTPQQSTPQQLMEIHINTLYGVDAQGRLRCVNEIGEPPAPLFYMGRTLEGNTWRFRHDLPADMVDELDYLCDAEPVATDLTTPPQNYASIWAVLREHATLQGQAEYRGLAYWMPTGIENGIENGIDVATADKIDVVPITASNSTCCQTTFPWLPPLLRESLADDQNMGPIAAVLVRARAVALCFCSRRPGQATEAGVETLAAYRGQGYGTAAVAAWAAMVRRLGCLPLYSAAWDNFASQAIARKLQMVTYGADWSIR